MDLKEKILKVLKPKAKSFGFNEEELKSAADLCSGNLNVTEETEESEVDAAIDKVVDTIAIPFLKMSQSAANRSIDAYKKAHPVTDPEEGKKKPEGSTGTEKTEVLPEWAKQLKEEVLSLKEENALLKSERVSTGRKERLMELTKGTGRFGDNFVKNFDRMSFKDDEDFETYLQSVKTEVDGYKQDLANHGLESLGNPPAPGKSVDEKKLTQSEIDAMAVV